MHPNTRFAPLAALLTLLVAACSSGKAGTSSTTITGCPKACPNDPPYSASDNADCVANVKDPACGAQAHALYDCGNANVTCDSSGKTDEAALMASCGSEKGAWETCQSTDGGSD